MNQSDNMKLKSQSNQNKQHIIKQEECHAVGCIDINTTKEFNGYFCQNHKESLSNIRYLLHAAIKKNDIKLELIFRKQEIYFRKYEEEGHIDYFNNLAYLVKHKIIIW